MKITINKKEIELRMSFKAMIMYENIVGKTFEGKSLTDILTYLYCIVLASTDDYSLSFDDFLKFMDDNPETLNEFTTWFQSMLFNQDKIKKNQKVKK